MTSRLPLSTGTRVFLAVGVVISLVNAVDFLFYGQELHDLMAGVGFALMSYGVYRNGFRTDQAGARSSVPLDQPARLANIAGIVLVLASFVIRFTR